MNESIHGQFSGEKIFQNAEPTIAQRPPLSSSRSASPAE
jgi:hypothetical protein